MLFETQATNIEALTPLLKSALDNFRLQRNFDVESYVKLKSEILNNYMTNSGLNTCVVAMSGGVDSAIVLAMVNSASKQKDSPIKKIVPITMSCTDDRGIKGVSNQLLTYQLSSRFCEKLKLKSYFIDMSTIVEAIKTQFRVFGNTHTEDLRDYYLDSHDTKWSEGQLVSYVRTSMLYYLTSIYTDLGQKPIIVGTTNKDEMSYIGFFGKASDAMVDVQLISDIHKSEVYKVAEYLGVPDEITKRPPNGDMYHNKTDEDFFGFSYDFLELYTTYLALPLQEQIDFYNALSKDFDSDKMFHVSKDNVEALHNVNKHKYPLRSSAVHFDTYKSDLKPEPSVGVDRSKLVNVQPFDCKDIINTRAEVKLERQEVSIKDKKIITIKKFLTDKEIQSLREANDKMPKVCANVHGLVHNTENDCTSVGSLRASIYNTELADTLYKRLSPYVDSLKAITEDDMFLRGGSIYRLVGMSPYFRLINYYHDHYLVPHYDAPHRYDNDTCTLMSVVLSLTTNNSGDTEFIDDTLFKPSKASMKTTQKIEGIDLKGKHYSMTFQDTNPYKDYNRLFGDDFSMLKQSLKHSEGDIHVFDHRLLHQVPNLDREHKLIIRTDLIFRKVY